MKKSKVAVLGRAFIFALIIGIGAFLAADYADINLYRAESKIVCSDKKELKNNNLTSTYAATIDSNAIRKNVISKLGLTISEEELKKKVDIEVADNASIISIEAVDNNKLRAEDIADEYADQSVTALKKAYGSKVEVLEYAYKNAGTVYTETQEAVFCGLVAFAIRLIIGLIRVGSYNRKLAKGEIDQEEETDL